jgi:hypothetical protein
MTQAKQSEKAKLFAGILSASEELLPEVKQRLEKLFGRVDFESEALAFNSTDYYEPQMGKNLKRKFYSFETLVEQDSLAEAKLATNKLEKEFAGRCEVKRPVNIDPGHLLASRIILASCKDFSHRIYLAGGVYAEVTLQFAGGAWRTLPWTFPDYRKAQYHKFFDMLRQRYVTQLRAQSLGSQNGV